MIIVGLAASATCPFRHACLCQRSSLVSPAILSLTYHHVGIATQSCWL